MQAIDLEQARTNMIINQVRAWEVLDEHVLATLRQVPREQFVAPQHRALAFADMMLPLGDGEVMFAPKYEARFLQGLAPRPHDRVLEVGTGSGYMAALLAACAGRVTSVDINAGFVEQAGARLRTLGFDNVTLATGDASAGWPQGGPYDVVMISGSLPVFPEELRDHVKPGGRIGVVIGSEPAMEALIYRNVGRGRWETESMFEMVVPPLRNARQIQRFVF